MTVQMAAQVHLQQDSPEYTDLLDLNADEFATNFWMPTSMMDFLML